MRTIHLAGVSIASTLALLGLAGLPAASALADSNSAAVAVTDSGFNPASVTVPVGGTVTWTDSGANVHTATSTGGIQTPFDSGGLSAGQAYSFTFTVPGTYQVASATDCLNGNSTPGFNCTPATVNVTNTPATTTVATQPAAPAPAAAASGTASGEPKQLPTCTYVTDASHPNLYCATSTGMQTVTLPASPSSGGVVTYTFNYPGDNSNILLTANVPSRIDPSLAGGVGASVFDAASKGSPVETDTLQSNQFGGDPNTFQLAYSSGNSGPVTIQLFNWTGKAVALNVSQSGLVRSDGTMSPVTLQLGSVSPQLA